MSLHLIVTAVFDAQRTARPDPKAMIVFSMLTGDSMKIPDPSHEPALCAKVQE
jgi:hypothetical protein